MFYIYDNKTNEFLKDSEGQVSPLEDGVFLKPPFSTTVKPPIITTDKQAILNVDNSWSLVDDNRDKSYWIKATKEKVVFALGDAIDLVTMTELEPIGEVIWDELSSKWIKDEQTILDNSKNSRKQELSKSFDTDVQAMVGTVPPHEIASWRKQEDQARAYVADSSASVPTLNSLVTARAMGESVLDLANKIIMNADAYETAYASLLGKHQSLTAQIDEIFVSTTLGDGGYATNDEAVAAVGAMVWN